MEHDRARSSCSLGRQPDKRSDATDPVTRNLVQRGNEDQTPRRQPNRADSTVTDDMAGLPW